MSIVTFSCRAATVLGIRYVAARRTNKGKIVNALCAAIVALATVPAATPSYAENVGYLSGAGSDSNPCTAAQPCQTVAKASGAGPNRVLCIDPPNEGNSILFANPTALFEIDCAGVWSPPAGGPAIDAITSTTFKIRNMTFSGRSGGPNAMKEIGSGTVIFENCVFEDFASAVALDLEPNGLLNIVIRNSRISSNASGILLKPAAGGSINATLDHVTIADNTGGGIKMDTTNGPVTVDIIDSVVSNNGGNGINAVGNAGGVAAVNIKNSVIAKNSVAGVQANGGNAGVFVQATLFDQNTAGATSVVDGGSMFTYGNNSIVGSAGSGFNRSPGLQ